MEQLEDEPPDTVGTRMELGRILTASKQAHAVKQVAYLR